MRELKQSTSIDLPIGPFVDATDGVTAETALTLTQPDIRLKKGGGGLGAEERRADASATKKTASTRSP